MLISDKEREDFMKQWDYWRKRIADGFTGSYPTDWFISVLDYLEEEHKYLLGDSVSDKKQVER